ncbi:hypothetical protein OHB26_28935 [Nocardia sp. NBC_01503]|uniref:hypothetical protein n=1 Tax=Nocardia sp. NBC_01503 TaxID=2975997 RepID=UPI002E7BB1C8|nr:hypothetical protein [Nocardia sp. NBC_01503]WTL30927.1 hypothetical protein OHB26_28935 [Nocardia sp. NBC_01503]
MTGALHHLASAHIDATAPPLSGYLIASTDRHISVRVTDGTWTLNRADVLDLTEREVAAAQGICEGRPVFVRVRNGATADFTQRRRIELTERPPTIPQDYSPARGDDELAALTEVWARGLELTPNPGVAGATMTCVQTRSLRGSDDGIAADSLD